LVDINNIFTRNIIVIGIITTYYQTYTAILYTLFKAFYHHNLTNW